MSATGRGAERRADDYYATPDWAIRAILPHFVERGLLHDRANILEPAAGDGAIVRALHAAGATVGNVEAIEIDPDRAAQSGARCADFLKVDPTLFPSFELVITNPPYALAFDFAQHALRFVRAGGALALLTRINWLASQKRAAWLRANTPSVHVLPKRSSFTGKGTDATDYAWLTWGRPWSEHHRMTPIVRHKAIERLIASSVSWAQATGDCHFCGGYADTGAHEEGCPVYPFDPPRPAGIDESEENPANAAD